MTDAKINFAPHTVSPDRGCSVSSTCFQCPYPDDCHNGDEEYRYDWESEARARRTLEVMTALHAGKSYRQITLEYGYTARAIAHISNTHRKAVRLDTTSV